MRASVIVATITVLLLGCTRIEIDSTPELPSLEGLSPTTIQTSLPVYNITVDANDFDHMANNPVQTIYIKGLLSKIDTSGTSPLTNEPVEIEIKGRTSVWKRMKSLGVIFQDPVENKDYTLLNPPKLINNHKLEDFHTLRFRNSGSDFGFTMLKDICYTELAIQADLDVELMYYQPVHLFLNDRYYGLENLRTENNRKGMAGLRAVDYKRVTVLKIDTDNLNIEWEEGSMAVADKFITALKEEDYESVWTMVDESSFIDYILFQDYVGNFDWPHNNMRMYAVDSGKFRFIVYDLDFAGFQAKNPLLPELEYLDDDLSKLYRQMRLKKGFDSRLKQRQGELYKIWSPGLFGQIVDRNSLKIADEIPYFIAKYGEPQSLFHWQLQLDLLKREFNSRDKHIRAKYDL